MFYKSCIIATCMFLSLQAATYGGKIGMDFMVSNQPTVGFRWHIADAYCMSPYVGFYHVGNGTGQGTPTLIPTQGTATFVFGIGNRIYLPSFAALDDYINVSPSVAVNNKTANFDGSVSYGLQYEINTTISIFGEAGVEVVTPQPTVGSFRSGIGLVFYFK
jgi:hypothetical protein